MRELPTDVRKAIERDLKTTIITMDIQGPVGDIERIWIDGRKFGVIEWKPVFDSSVSPCRIEMLVIELENGQ